MVVLNHVALTLAIDVQDVGVLAIPVNLNGTLSDQLVG